MSTNQMKGSLGERLTRLEEVAADLVDQIRDLKEMQGDTTDQGLPLDSGGTPGDQKSQFQRVAEVLMAKGNRPRTASAIMKAAGISRSALSQILHRTHKDYFVSIPIPGYSRKKLWSLSDGAVSQLASPFTQPTLFGREGDLSHLSGMDCCARILRDHNNQPMDALTMAQEAIARGYRGRAKGKESANEVLLTIAKGFWAALGRDERFEVVRPLVFRLRNPGVNAPLKPPGAKDDEQAMENTGPRQDGGTEE
jgi:hypothetical protein